MARGCQVLFPHSLLAFWLVVCNHSRMNAKKYRNWMAKQALRRQKIKDFHATGKTLREVAYQFRISRGRVWQIVRDYVK